MNHSHRPVLISNKGNDEVSLKDTRKFYQMRRYISPEKRMLYSIPTAFIFAVPYSME